MRKAIVGLFLCVFFVSGVGAAFGQNDVVGRVVFVSLRSGAENLWIYDMEKGTLLQLTDFPAECGLVHIAYPRWSPDGKKISFGGRGPGGNDDMEVYTIDVQSRALTQVTVCPDRGQAYISRWDPNDSNVLFYIKGMPSNPAVVYRKNLRTGIEEMIPNSSGSNTQDFVVTNDGARILFSRGWAGGLYSGYQDFYGGNERIIIPTDGIPENVHDINRQDEWILLIQYYGPGNDIYKMDRDGSQKLQLTSGVNSYWAVWTNGDNSGNIVFQTYYFGQAEIVLMKADGASFPHGMVNLSNHPAEDRDPDWTATGWNSAPVAAAKDLSLSAGANCLAMAAAADFDNGSSDPDGDELTFAVSPQGPYPLGETQVTLTVTDANGASSEVTALVTVYDETAPTPDLAALPTLTGQCSVDIPAAPTATDNCAGLIIGKTADPLSYAAQGTYIVTWVFEDGHGNASTQTQTVVVKDTVAPIIQAISASPNTLWSPNHKMVPVTIAVTATDACSASVTSRIVAVESNEPEDGLGDGDTAPDWEFTGLLTLNLRAERSGTGDGRTYTIIIECKDANGNVTTGTATVTVPKSKGR